MKRIFKTKTFLGLATASLLMVGCVNDKIDGPSVSNTTQTEIENAFDFSSTKDVTISLDYPTFAHVEIYDKLPTEEGAKLLFRTYTGANGAFEGITTLPSAYIGKTVYVIANGINCPAVSEAQITKEGITLKAVSKATRANNSGFSDTELSTMIAALKKALPESKDNYETVQKQYTSKANIDIEVNGLNDSAPTAEIKVSFLQTEGWNHNTLYYYVYEEGEEPTKSDLDKFINKKYRIYGPVWTADNQIENEGEAGYTVTLKNPNRADGNFENGDCIGFILKSNPYDNLSHSDYFYTRNIDYPENFSQAARFAYNNKALVYTFEDQPIYKNGFNRPREKADYNDFSFIVQSTPIEAIDDPEIPDLPTPPFYLEEKGAPYTGTLLFEDMYPSQGDYDMNDVIVEYNLVPCTHILYDPELDTTTPPYYLSSIDYTFTPVWDGADYGASFSFMIDNINIDNTATKKTVENIFSIPANEEKGELNMGSYEGSVDFGFVIEKIPNGNNQYEEVYESGGVNLGEEPKFSWANCFNPFITVDYTGYEVHLSKKAPSDNAKEDGLDEWALNYVYKDSKFPYAMNIPITDYQVVTEKERIDSFYPTYVQWVESEGQEATDWYIKK